MALTQKAMEVTGNVKKKGIVKPFKNPIVKMIEDKLRIEDAAKKGEKITSLKGIKFVSPI